jgi:hypothetical protein
MQFILYIDGFIAVPEVSLRILVLCHFLLGILVNDTSCRNSEIQHGARKVRDLLTGQRRSCSCAAAISGQKE